MALIEDGDGYPPVPPAPPEVPPTPPSPWWTRWHWDAGEQMYPSQYPMMSPTPGQEIAPPPPEVPPAPDQLMGWLGWTGPEGDGPTPPPPGPYTPMTPEAQQPGWPYLPQGWGWKPMTQLQPITRRPGWPFLPQGWGREPPPPEEVAPWGQPLKAGEAVYPWESIWRWLKDEGYEVDPHFLERAKQARVRLEPQMQWSGLYYAGEMIIASRLSKGGAWKHELAHHMDWVTGVQLRGEQPGWQEAVDRWVREDRQQYPTISSMPGMEKGKPDYVEIYAVGSLVPGTSLPPYIRVFYPWLYGRTATMASPETIKAALRTLEEGKWPPAVDWPTEEEPKTWGVACSGQIIEIRVPTTEELAAAHEATKGAEERKKLIAQAALDMGIGPSELDRMWAGNYQEHPIPYMAFLWSHDRFKDAEAARVEWQKIPEKDRYLALELFFDFVWPIVKNAPEDWQDVKDLLDYMGIVDVREKGR